MHDSYVELAEKLSQRIHIPRGHEAVTVAAFLTQIIQGSPEFRSVDDKILALALDRFGSELLAALQARRVLSEAEFLQ
jgi:hypothetical protein